MHRYRRLFHSPAFRLGTKACLTLVAFWFVLQGIDFGQLGGMMLRQDRTLVLLASALMMVQSVLGGVRWRMITNALAAGSDHRIGVMDAQRLYYIGVFFTTCLPGTVGGDMVRIWMARDIHIPLAQAIHSVIIDRMIALFAIGIMMLITLPVLAEVTAADPFILYPVSAALILGGLVLLRFLERLLAPHARHRPVHWSLVFLRSVKLILTHPRTCLCAAGLALVAHASFSLSAYVLAQSLDVPMTAMQSLAFIPLVMLVTTIPISFGGWGLREASMVGLLGLAGIPQEAALMLSIQLGLLFMLVSLPASLWWLAGRSATRAPGGADPARGRPYE
jgi:uncharacterized membrane protein YbhN (UPF0104 family)